MNETIINGIDVSECEYAADTIPVDCENNTCFCYEDENCYFKQLKRLQKENEELRQVRKNSPDIQEPYIYLYRQIKKQCYKLEEETQELKENQCCPETCEHIATEIIRYSNVCEINLKYKQALEEIKKWATNHNPCDIDPEVKCTKEDCFNCLNYDLKRITNIIDEVLNENS